MNSRFPPLLLATLGSLLLLTACSTPERRAMERPTAFGKLSAEQKKLVLGGQVRRGMSPDAVYIAWGAPDLRLDNGKSKTAMETWIYARELSVYRPMEYYDYAYPSLEQRGPSFAYGRRDSFGYGAIANAGFAYPPRAFVTEVRVKRAKFVDKKLDHLEVQRGAQTLTSETDE